MESIHTSQNNRSCGQPLGADDKQDASGDESGGGLPLPEQPDEERGDDGGGDTGGAIQKAEGCMEEGGKTSAVLPDGTALRGDGGGDAAVIESAEHGRHAGGECEPRKLVFGQGAYEDKSNDPIQYLNEGLGPNDTGDPQGPFLQPS